MKEIKTLEELQIVVINNIEYIFKSLTDCKIICHPMAPITFLPTGLKSIPNDKEGGIALGWMLLYSIDQKEWTFELKEVLRKAIQNQTSFYLCNWQLTIVMEVKQSMIREITDYLIQIYADLTLIEGYIWKRAMKGEIKYIDCEEYFYPGESGEKINIL